MLWDRFLLLSVIKNELKCHISMHRFFIKCYKEPPDLNPKGKTMFVINITSILFYLFLISSLSWLSVLYGILASVSAALSGVYIKRVDRLLGGNSLQVSGPMLLFF